MAFISIVPVRDSQKAKVPYKLVTLFGIVGTVVREVHNQNALVRSSKFDGRLVIVLRELKMNMVLMDFLPCLLQHWNLD